MKISEILSRDNNNLDLFRIILASMVIIGHTEALNGFNDNWVDPIKYFFPYIYSGSFAVQMFFFISGLLVANSLFKSQNPTKFIISRLFRIYPALVFIITITAIIIGPILTSHTFSSYFSDPITFKYFEWLSFKMSFNLPGVFENNLYKFAINGSLWTLLFEVYCYIALLGIYLLIQKRAYVLWNIIFLLILVDHLLPQRFIFNWLYDFKEITIIPICFALGVFFANNAEKITINGKSAIGAIIAVYCLRNTSFEHITLITSSAILILYLSSNTIILKFRPKYDISYGVYLWGFLVQQSVYHYIGKVHPLLHMSISIFISIIFGLITFILIEQNFIKLGSNLSRYLISRFKFLN